MTLDDHRLMILIAAGTLLKHNHIIQFILHITDAMLLGERNQIITDHLGVAGAMRNGTQLLKIAKYRRRLKARKLDRIHRDSPLQSFLYGSTVLGKSLIKK